MKAPEGDTSAFLLHARPEISTAYASPTTELEEMVAAIWQELLGIEQVGIYDNFFDLGGNSLIGLKIISRLKKELDRDIPVVTLFEGPTISTFAQILGQDQRKKVSYEGSRSRGVRRREKIIKNRGIDSR